MWEKLKLEDKEKYKLLITNFASLSEAFSQKSETDIDEEFVAPIVNSKFQETVFQKAFSAVGEDIANTSYDASVVVDDKHKYLVGIKSFGINSGDQKIAQFKKDSQEWTDILNEIKKQASNSSSKEDADVLNEERYRWLAKEIARLRNQRIESSKAQIKGFNSTEVDVESIYHVLMPTKKGDVPQIFVGETSYLPIDVENLNIMGATSINNPTNFRFSDGNHVYKYTAADSQLHMTFNNKDIIVEEWAVKYVEDPFSIFENLHILSEEKEKSKILDTVSWVIMNKSGEVEESSGFNAFNGLGSKKGKEERRRILNKIVEQLPEKNKEIIQKKLEKLLFGSWGSKKLKQEGKEVRANLLELIKDLSQQLKEEIENLVYRPAKEVYIPIPESRKFHTERPNFFGENIGLLNGEKLVSSKENRVFKLKFLASGDVIDAYINQDTGKAIQSFKRQDILGEWLLKEVFRLKDREPLTGKRLEELEINGIRLTKFEDCIGIEFIWIDITNPPEDAIGWISKK